MTNIYFFQKSLLIESEISLDLSLKNILWETLSRLIEKMYLAARHVHFQKNMCQIFGDSSQVESLQRSWMSRDFRILSGICITSSQEFDGHCGNEDRAFSQIRLAEDLILNYQNDINKLMNFILQALSYRISAQIFNGDKLEENFSSFSHLVLSQESESLGTPHNLDGNMLSNNDLESDSNLYTPRKDFPEEITPSFVTVQGEVYWKDSSGNLHPLPI